MSLDFTKCAELNRIIWQRARNRVILAMTDEQLNKALSNHPNTRKALQRLNADIAKLPPVVDNDYFVELERAAYDAANCGDRFE